MSGHRIRKLVTVSEEVLVEGGRDVAVPSRLTAVAAVVENPLAGRYADDLAEFLNRLCPLLGVALAERLTAAVGGAQVEAYGKAGIVGLDGEVEHVAGVLHNLRFGDPIRDAVAATSLLSSTEKRAAAGATVDIPLKHIHDHKMRSHHQTFELRIGDAPMPDEMLIAIAVAEGGRPHSRLGEFGTEVAAGASPA
jgi:hypothetical protein